jgi:CDP-glucose 4,6-dehydratase
VEDLGLVNDRDWSTSHVLITGAGGFVGAHLAEALLNRGARVTALICERDPDSRFWTERIFEQCRLVCGRLEQPTLLHGILGSGDIDTVYHLGAQTIVNSALRDPLTTMESNIRGTCLLLEACREAGDAVRRIVIASSDKAYGETGERPTREDDPLAGRYPYDVSKACGDLLAQSYAHTYRLPIAIARCGNVFGPGDTNMSRIAPSILRDLHHGNRPVIRSDGSPKRDYVFIDDIVRGYLLLGAWLDALRDEHTADRAFNFSGQSPISVREMTELLCRAADREDLAPIIEDREPAQIQHQHLDASRAESLLGWRVETDLKTALKRTAQWYRAFFKRRTQRDAPVIESLSQPRSAMERTP